MRCHRCGWSLRVKGDICGSCGKVGTVITVMNSITHLGRAKPLDVKDATGVPH